MKFFSPIIILCFVFVSCAESKDGDMKETETTNNVIDSDKNIQNYTMNGCYRMIIENDTATMKVSQEQDSIIGSLIYKRKDKDSNKGEVHLLKTKDRVEGWYTYQSEGTTSVRQIVFKTTDSSFAEAYGDIKMRNDTALFKYPHALNYEEKHSFNKVNCN